MQLKVHGILDLEERDTQFQPAMKLCLSKPLLKEAYDLYFFFKELDSFSKVILNLICEIIFLTFFDIYFYEMK